MTIAIGDKIPAGTLIKVTDSGPAPVTTEEYFAGRKVALFSVPGAFTPTCSAKHLPGFVERAADLKAKGHRRNRVHCGQRRIRNGRLGKKCRR